MPTTFEAPDYIIGNSATITAQLSSVLTTLDQALQALQPAPNATTVQFNDTVFIQDPAVLTQSATLEKNRLDIDDGVYTSTYQPSVLQMTDNLGTYLDHSITFQMAGNPNGNLHSAGAGNGDNREVSFSTDDVGHPLLLATLYENSTIIRDDYIKIGNKSYNTAINSGDLYCNNVSLNTINGLTPTTIGLTWADFSATNAYTNLPTSNSYALDNGAGNSSALSVSTLAFTDVPNGESSSLSSSTLTFITPQSGSVISNTGGYDMTVQSSNQLLLIASDIASVTAGSSFNVVAGDQVNITATNDFMSLQADDDISLVSNGLGNIVLNAPNINSYGYALPICFEALETAQSINYGSGGQSMNMVFQGNFNIPADFFCNSPQSGYTSTQWRIDFAINTYSGSGIGFDKGFATYIDFNDQAMTFYSPFLYNATTPYARYFNQGSYVQASPLLLPWGWTDVVDFAGLAGTTGANLPLKINLYVAADGGFSCNFNWKVSLTRTNVV